MAVGTRAFKDGTHGPLALEDGFMFRFDQHGAGRMCQSYFSKPTGAFANLLPPVSLNCRLWVSVFGTNFCILLFW